MNRPDIHIGDCLDIMRSMPEGSIDLIATDPPFGTGKDFGAYNDKFDDYLDFLAPILLQLHRLLKDTGSLYLHCDWRYSHYIKVMLDEIFGRKNFRNEIVWGYSSGGTSPRYFARKHDTILFYSKCGTYTFNTQYQPHLSPINDNNRHRFNPKGKIMLDWWYDIQWINNMAKERVGYPTQKPLKLYERIIKASSNEGDTVLDPFCGSGTTLIAANKLNRHSIGIDINSDVKDIINSRLGADENRTL